METENTLYFHKYSENREGTALNSVICKTACIQREQVSFNGMAGHTRTTGDAKFCLLIITDENGVTVNPRQYKFEKDQPIPGIIDSGKPVLDMTTGEPAGLTWAMPIINNQSE